MRRQSYLGRIAGVAPARGPQLTVLPDVAGAPPMTLALSSLLQNLSNPSVPPLPATERHETAAREPATAKAAPGEPAFAAPEPGPPSQRPVISFQRSAPAAIPTVRTPSPLRPATRRLPPEERPMTTVRPASSAADAAARIGTPLESDRTVPPDPAPAEQGHASMTLPSRAAVQPAPVHVHIGTIEVRTKAPAARVLPPAAATMAPAPPAAPVPMPPRGYGWRFGLVQR